ncbi:glycosyltransferase family 2 protein [Tianweitania populi]|uniref:Glycosyl transferase n=2 Tax=Tianweitania populi TaxID=1607949 RepID=A0A8J3DXV0_9HYPH|nr:glycosyl transferase [Tianweitania populi]
MDRYHNAWMRKPEQPFLVLGIATAGRRDLLSEVFARLDHQSTYPDLAVVCGTAVDDVDKYALARAPFPVVVLHGVKGLALQRNAILDLLEAHWPEASLLLFLDDDFVPATTFVEQAISLANDHPEVVLATGTVLKDGIKNSGVPLTEAIHVLDDDQRSGRASRIGALQDVYNVYGCNMLLRLRPILEQGARFDANLPLYSWLEDVEFSRAVARCGRIVRSSALRGVHLGTKSGRTPGIKFGYSQVANPIYLWRKNRMTARRTVTRVARNLIANLVRSFRPEPWVDRRGRLKGNLIGLSELLAGRLSPMRILDLD